MNEASPTERWRVRQAITEISLDQWIATVDRVLRFRVVLKQPNPHHGDRANVEQLIEGANARMAEIVWQADPDNLKGLDMDDSFVQEAIQHAKK